MAGLRAEFRKISKWKLAFTAMLCAFWLFMGFGVIHLIWISWPRCGTAASISEVGRKYGFKAPVEDIPISGDLCYKVFRGAHAVRVVVICGIIPASEIESVMAKFPKWEPRLFDGVDFNDDELTEQMAGRMGAKRTETGWRVDEPPDSNVPIPTGWAVGERAGATFCHYFHDRVTVDIELSSGTGCFRMHFYGLGLE
ncbi:MAG: hypothetical protein AB7F40_07120 [Victivallaceae bacterium]|nr:hypothetical protein [Victivallaceae bacterium]